MGDPAVWADGEVRDLESNRPITSALLTLEVAATAPGLAAADRTNDAGRFAVFQAVGPGARRIPLLAQAAGYKTVAFDVTVMRSNTILFRLAPEGSAKPSRAEEMAVPPGHGDGVDSSCDSE